MSPLQIARALTVSQLPTDEDGGFWLNPGVYVRSPEHLLYSLRAELDAARPNGLQRRAALNRLRLVLRARREAADAAERGGEGQRPPESTPSSQVQHGAPSPLFS